MYRVLRFIHQASTLPKATEFIGKRMKDLGNVLFVRYGEPFLIAKTSELQMDHKYVPRRIKEIEEEWNDVMLDKERRLERYRKLRKDGKDDAAKQLMDEHVKVYNGYGWVKFMKEKVGFTEEDVLEPGVRCEAPPDEDVTEEFEEDGIDLHVIPDRVVVAGQKHVALSVLMSNDDSMETVVYLHDVISEIPISDEATRGAFEQKMNNIAMFSTPMPIDVVDVGVWNMPVRCLWTNEPLEQSYGNSELNDFQQQRITDARKRDMEKSRLMEEERQSELAFQDLVRVSELPLELVKQICSTQEGGQEFVHAVKLANKASREDAIELCIQKYGTPEGGAPGPPLKSTEQP